MPPLPHSALPPRTPPRRPVPQSTSSPTANAGVAATPPLPRSVGGGCGGGSDGGLPARHHWRNQMGRARRLPWGPRRSPQQPASRPPPHPRPRRSLGPAAAAGTSRPRRLPVRGSPLPLSRPESSVKARGLADDSGTRLHEPCLRPDTSRGRPVAFPFRGSVRAAGAPSVDSPT